MILKFGLFKFFYQEDCLDFDDMLKYMDTLQIVFVLLLALKIY